MNLVYLYLFFTLVKPKTPQGLFTCHPLLDASPQPSSSTFSHIQGAEEVITQRSEAGMLGVRLMAIQIPLRYLLCNLVAVQSLSHVRLFLAPRTAACQSSLSSTISRSWFRLMSIESVMLSNHLIPCHPILGHIVKLLWPQLPHLKSGNHHSVHLEGLIFNEMTYVSLSGCPISRLQDKHL